MGNNSVGKEIICIAAISRTIILIAMSISCMILSSSFTIFPGDDVLVFDMRLSSNRPYCFCRKGDACDLNTWEKYERNRLDLIFRLTQQPRSISMEQKDKCALSSFPSIWNMESSFLVSTTSNNNLVYLTEMKDIIYNFFLAPLTRWDAARFLSIAVRPTIRNPWYGIMEEKNSYCDGRVKQRQKSSEEAHAFFPLVPWSVRATALFLVLVIPQSILPSTFEAVSVLAALYINTLCFIGSAFILQKFLYYKMSKRMNKHLALKASVIATTIFCLNPASVFFTTSYSESMFAFLTYLGYFFVDSWRYPGGILSATVVWALASFCRSNGIFSSCYIILHLLAKLWNYFHTCHPFSESFVYTLYTVIFHLFLALLIALPLRLHDFHGYQTHCYPGASIMKNAEVPDWCENSFRFSLYAHVQRKYWNVGFFRYYEWKQLPNFFLAIPILYIGLQTVVNVARAVIFESLKSSDTIQVTTISKLHGIFHSFFSSIVGNNAAEATGKTHVPDIVLVGREWSGHVIILAIFCIMGITVAHIQISTRLLCASCPVIYVSMAQLFLDSSRKKIVTYYLILFNVLGILLHPNWLPWT